MIYILSVRYDHARHGSVRFIRQSRLQRTRCKVKPYFIEQRSERIVSYLLNVAKQLNNYILYSHFHHAFNLEEKRSHFGVQLCGPFVH